MINIRYAQIRECDVSNGEGVGVALFVQGCNFHCYNCFNKDTWDFNGGNEWTPEVEDKFIELASRPYIKRISILGGEPLADENLDGILNLVNRFRLLLPKKTIWLYTGYQWEDIINFVELCDMHEDYSYEIAMYNESMETRQDIIKSIDVLVDGVYIDSQKDVSLCWRGSKNQRVIDVKKSLQKGEVVLYCE